MELSKEIIGYKLKEFRFKVERKQVLEFLHAIGETHPLYTDSEFAKSVGFLEPPLPPTFQTTFQFYGYPELWKEMREIGVDTKNLLHIKEEYTYHHPLYAEDTVTGRGQISDVKLGKMNIVSMKSEYYNQKEQLCIEAVMSIVIRPQNKTENAS